MLIRLDMLNFEVHFHMIKQKMRDLAQQYHIWLIPAWIRVNVNSRPLVISRREFGLEDLWTKTESTCRGLPSPIILGWVEFSGQEKYSNT